MGEGKGEVLSGTGFERNEIGELTLLRNQVVREKACGGDGE